MVSMNPVLDLPLRGPVRKMTPDLVFQRGSCLSGQPYRGRDRHQHRLAIRHGPVQSSLQTSNKPERHPVEPQARLRVSAPVAYSLDGDDFDRNALRGDRDISVGRLFASFPRRREMPGDGFDGGLLLLPQLAHVRRRAARVSASAPGLLANRHPILRGPGAARLFLPARPSGGSRRPRHFTPLDSGSDLDQLAGHTRKLENLPCFRSSRPSRTFRAMARSCMSWRIRSRMYSLGVAYTSLSLARSSTYLRSASVNWTLRLLLKVWRS